MPVVRLARYGGLPGLGALSVPGRWLLFSAPQKTQQTQHWSPWIESLVPSLIPTLPWGNRQHTPRRGGISHGQQWRPAICGVSARNCRDFRTRAWSKPLQSPRKLRYAVEVVEVGVEDVEADYLVGQERHHRPVLHVSELIKSLHGGWDPPLVWLNSNLGSWRGCWSCICWGELEPLFVGGDGDVELVEESRETEESECW